MGRKTGRPALGRTRLTVYVDPEVKRMLEREAFERDTTVTEIVNEALRTRTRYLGRTSDGDD